jgi:crossover junction endodeoxyribonuclease RuvC
VIATSPMRILGVDPGSRAAGWAIVDFSGAPALVAAGVLRPPLAGEFAGRLAFLHAALGAVIAGQRPDAAAVERVFSGVNPQSLIALGEARGVLLLALAEAGVRTEEVTPAEIKRAVTGSGGAEKEQVRRMVHALLGKRLALDAADAAAAALTLGFVVARRGASFAAPARTAGADRPAVKRRPGG